MSLVTVFSDASDQKRVVTGVISMPRQGVWHADLFVDSDDQFDVGTGVTIGMNDGAQFLNGTVARALLYQGMQQVRVVAGAGGMQAAAKPRFYQQPAAADVLADLAKDAGETLADDVDLGGAQFDAWTTIASTVGRQLAELIRPIAGCIWRITADGKLWVGSETWPASDVSDDEWATLDYDHWRGVIRLGMLAPTLLPGTVLGQEKIDRVEHHIDRDTVRTLAWVFRDGPAGVDQDFQAVARAASRPFDFFPLYAGTTKAQNQQTFDVQPDDDRLPLMTGVPIRNGIPSLLVTVPPGARVLVGWDGGDPRAPFCALWGGGEKGTSLIYGGASADQPWLMGKLLTDLLSKVLQALATHTHPTGVGPSGPPEDPSPYTDADTDLPNTLSDWVITQKTKP